MSGASFSSTEGCGGVAVVPGHLPAGEKDYEDISVLLPASNLRPPLRRDSWAARKLSDKTRG